MRRLTPLLMVLAFGLGLTCAEARACPNCKEAVSSQPSDSAGMAKGYNLSVVFMLAVPFTLLSAGSFAVARAVKRGVLPEL
jgi:hypothetical protein